MYMRLAPRDVVLHRAGEHEDAERQPGHGKDDAHEVRGVPAVVEVGDAHDVDLDEELEDEEAREEAVRDEPGDAGGHGRVILEQNQDCVQDDDRDHEDEEGLGLDDHLAQADGLVARSALRPDDQVAQHA